MGEEYWLNLYVGGECICDPFLRYASGFKVKVKEDPDTISYFELRKIVQNGTIDMISHWNKFKEINVYVEHEVDTGEDLVEGPIGDGTTEVPEEGIVSEGHNKVPTDVTLDGLVKDQFEGNTEMPKEGPIGGATEKLASVVADGPSMRIDEDYIVGVEEGLK
ncbi:hypothetical protein GOBAR_DD00272 [Gossypium barbadense]|nr:hypothetical protein GOBAR_DD00272 [Gossypium barbadense]